MTFWYKKMQTFMLVDEEVIDSWTVGWNNSLDSVDPVKDFLLYLTNEFR